MTRRELSRSIRWPKLLQPSPTSETRRPDLPRLRKIMFAPYLTRRSRSHALPPETTVRLRRTRASPNVLLLDSCQLREFPENKKRRSFTDPREKECSTQSAPPRG